MTETIEFETSLNSSELSGRLESSFVKPTIGETLIPLKVRLGGEINGSEVKIFRNRGGRRWYLRFEGCISSQRFGSLLRGSILHNNPAPNYWMMVWCPILVILVMVLMIMRGSGLGEIAELLVPLGVTSAVSVGAVWYRKSALRAERDLLISEITEALDV